MTAIRGEEARQRRRQEDEEEAVFGGWSCLYDELMPSWRSMARAPADERAIDAAYDAVRAFVARHYSRDYNRLDREHDARISERGNRGLKLAFVLLMLAQHQCLRDEVRRTARGTPTREQSRKLTMFYRPLSIATRGLLETAYDDGSAAMLVMMFLRECFLAWACMDSSAMSMRCDFFATPYRDRKDPSLNDVRCDDGGLFEEADIRRPMLTAEQIAADHGLPPPPPPPSGADEEREETFT